MVTIAQAVPDPTSVLSLSEKLATQSDRVLFILSQLIMLGFAYLVIKHLVKTNSQLTAELKEIANSNNVSRNELSANVSNMSKEVALNTTSVKENTNALYQVKSKLHIPAVAILALIMTGCAKFSGYTERDFSPDGKLIHERAHMRSYTLFDGKSEVARAKSLQTDKTQSVGIQDSKQESKGDVLPAAIKAAGEAAPSFIKPIP